MTKTGGGSSGLTAPSRAGATMAMIVVLVAIYILSQFFRNSLGVIGPDLAEEFRLDAAQLSMLASAFFLSFALVQIPLGIAIDRFGPKICILAPAAILFVGTMLFSYASTYAELVLARLIIGLGCSSFLMAPLTIYSEKFPPQAFGAMVGFQVGMGNLGALAATAPLAFVADWLGWRAGFALVGALVLAVFIGVCFLVNEDPVARERRKKRAESPRALLAGVLAAARTRSFAPIFLMQLTAYPAFATILGLWAGPWLAQVYGFDLAGRGNMLFIMAIAQICALFGWGMADRLVRSYKLPCMTGASLCVIALATGALMEIPASWLAAYFIALGLVFGFSPALTSHGKSLFPAELTGRGLSLMNVAAMGGVFLQQILTGFVINMFEAQIVDGAHIYPPEAYRWVFGVLAAEIAVAIAFYTTTRDPHPLKSGG